MSSQSSVATSWRKSCHAVEAKGPGRIRVAQSHDHLARVTTTPIAQRHEFDHRDKLTCRPAKVMSQRKLAPRAAPVAMRFSRMAATSDSLKVRSNELTRTA